MTLPDDFRVILVLYHGGYETWLMNEKVATTMSHHAYVMAAAVILH